jgi:hypothetical protein
MIRAHLATADITGLEMLDRIIAQTAVTVFQATQRFGKLDEAAEEEFVRKLDEALGFSPAETLALLNESRVLMVKAAGAPTSIASASLEPTG